MCCRRDYLNYYISSSYIDFSDDTGHVAVPSTSNATPMNASGSISQPETASSSSSSIQSSNDKEFV